VTTIALIVFLRGINVGRLRRFRPRNLARELNRYGVVNVGAAGTFIVRKPRSRAKFRAELLRKLPFDAEVVFCDGRDLIRLEIESPFGTEPSRHDIVRFVSILSRAGRSPADIPFTLPPSGEWFEHIRHRILLQPIIMSGAHSSDSAPGRVGTSDTCLPDECGGKAPGRAIRRVLRRLP
jgi:hypothetical protein